MKNKAFAFLSLLTLTACSTDSVKTETFFYRAYGVFASEFAVTYNAEKDLEKEIDEFISSFTIEADPYSQHKGVNGVYEINQTNEPVKVSDDLFDAIDRAWTIKSETEGYFNPLIFDLSSLWKKTIFGGIIADPDYMPTKAKIDEAKEQVPALLEKMNNSSLILDAANKTVQRQGEAKLDLGGIAKGYAVEKVDSILKASGVTEYFVNGGTSSLGFGNAQGGGAFRVKLKYTGDDETSLRYYVQNTFTSLSAIYEQHRHVDGLIYSHVINTVTGLPLTDYSMAFLQGDDSTRLDAFSTACMIAGIDKTKEWENKYGFKAVLFEHKVGDGTDEEHEYGEMVYENKDLKRV